MHKPTHNRAKLAQRILWRHADFESGVIEHCYVVQNDRAVKISLKEIKAGKREIIQEINKLDL